MKRNAFDTMTKKERKAWSSKVSYWRDKAQGRRKQSQDKLILDLIAQLLRLLSDE